MTRLSAKRRHERTVDLCCAAIITFAVAFFGIAIACAAVLP